MVPRTEAPDIPLGEVVARIVEAVRPWRIVLFGSRARGNAMQESDYDLYVEVDASTTPLNATRDRIWKLIGGGLTIDLKVQARGTIERRRDDPGTIEWDIAREGRMLYADPAAPTNLAPPRQVGEPSPAPPESLHEWLQAAERDAHAAELLSADESLAPTICWLSHQMCEKYMKALLVSRRVRPERTHQLELLLIALRRAGCPLPRLDADCELLTRHAITPRYPAGNDLGVDDARTATDAAARIIAAVRAELPPSVH